MIVKNDGCSLITYNTEVGKSATYFQIEQGSDATIQKINNEDILIIRFHDGTLYTPNNEVKTTNPSKDKQDNIYPRFPNVDIENYHGFLLDKGNCVYLTTTHDTDCERAFIDGAKEQISKDKFWTVVDTPEQAHFILQYVLITRGLDRGYLLLRTRDNYKNGQILMVDLKTFALPIGCRVFHYQRSNEDVEDNKLLGKSVLLTRRVTVQYFIENSREYKTYLETGKRPECVMNVIGGNNEASTLSNMEINKIIEPFFP